MLIWVREKGLPLYTIDVYIKSTEPGEEFKVWHITQAGDRDLQSDRKNERVRELKPSHRHAETAEGTGTVRHLWVHSGNQN